LNLQVKLLRALQEEEIIPLGATSPRQVDVRVIAATSKDLKKEVAEGKFREDLYYRINVMSIHLPPLRERRGDIPLLIGYHVDQFNRKLKTSIEGLSSEAMALLIGYSWPGNIRELENVLERSMLLTKGQWITPTELPAHIRSSQPLLSSIRPEHNLSIKKASKLLEKDLIQKALELTKGNRTQASKILEISRPILIAKIKEYRIE
jgi:two-component system response regulator AtoC